MIRNAMAVWSIVGMALSATLVVASPAVARDESARLFASHVLALRNGAVTGEDMGLAVLARMPGAPRGDAVELWPPVFENTILSCSR